MPQVEILAKEFLTSLTEPKNESKEAEIKENSVRFMISVSDYFKHNTELLHI